MSTSNMVPMLSPDGTPGYVPSERVNEALQNGGKMGIKMQSPTGETGIIPRENVVEAIRNGGKVIQDPSSLPTQFEQERSQYVDPGAQMPGQRWAAPAIAAGKEVLNIAGSIPGAVKSLADPFGTAMKQTADLSVNDQLRKVNGRGVPYRAAAALGTPMGVNVQEMEHQADIGNGAGVIGTAIGDAVPVIAGEALRKYGPNPSELVGKLKEGLKPSNLFSGKQAVVYPEAANLPAPAVKAVEGIFQAAAPTGLNRNFRANLYAATPDLAEIGRNIKLDEAKGGLINPDMRVKATVDAIDSHLSDMYNTERAPQIERNAYRPIHSASFGPDAIEGLKYIERTAGTDALRGMATKALEEGVLPLSEADQLAMAVNKNLRSFERMTPAEQAAAGITNRRMGSLDALDSAFGKSINQALKRAGEPGIQGYERRYAALSEISSQLGKRVNAVELNQPGIIKGVLKPVAGALRGGPSGIASASQAAVADVNIGRMLQQSFEQLAATDLAPNRAIRKP